MSGYILNLEQVVKQSEYICIVEPDLKTLKLVEQDDYRSEIMEMKVIEVLKAPEKNPLLAANQQIKIQLNDSFLDRASELGVSVSAASYYTTANPKKDKKLIIYLGHKKEAISLMPKKNEETSAKRVWDLTVQGAYDKVERVDEVKKFK